MRSLPYSIFVCLSEWSQVSYLNLVWFIFYFYLLFHVDLSRLHEFHNSTNLFKLVFICRYICDIFVHAQICTNYCFIPNSFSAKEDYYFFPSSLARITDEVEHPWFLSSHGESLAVLIYCVTFSFASPTCLSVSV